MVPPLVDAELTRQLVCDVLRDNLRSILSTPQWQQEAARAQQRAAEPLSLEEVVAQLAAMPLMPPPRGPPQTTGMEGGVGQPQAEGAPDVDAEAAAGVDVEPTGLEQAGYAQVPASHSGEEAAEGSQPVAGHDAAECGATAPLDAVASRVSAGEDEDEAASFAGAGAASSAAPPLLGSQASHASLQSGPSASALSMQGSQHPLQSGPSQRSVSRVGHPPTGHPPLHPPPSAQPSSASLPPHPHALPAPHALPGHAAAASSASPAPPAPPGAAPLVVSTAQPWDQHHGPAAAAAAAADDGGGHPDDAGLALVVQAHGVQGRGTQAHGVDDRCTQAHAVQDVGTQAAGVKDSGSQADPPPPHYLLQAALAAGGVGASGSACISVSLVSRTENQYPYSLGCMRRPSTFVCSVSNSFFLTPPLGTCAPCCRPVLRHRGPRAAGRRNRAARALALRGPRHGAAARPAAALLPCARRRFADPAAAHLRRRAVRPPAAVQRNGGASRWQWRGGRWRAAAGAAPAGAEEAAGLIGCGVQQ